MSTDTPLPVMKLDTTRGFGFICPPEALLCANGKSIPASHREDNPSSFRAFHQEAGEDAVVTKVRHYEQDGFSFDAEGFLIEEVLDKQARHRALEIEARRKAKIAARRAHDDAMREQGFAPGTFVSLEEEEAGPITATDVATNPADGSELSGVKRGSDVDIVTWARGDLSVPWFAVAKAIREKYSFNPSNRAEAIAWLVENNIIPASVVAG